MIVIVVLLAAALLAAPILSGVPDEPVWSSVLCAFVLLAAVVGAWQAGRGGAFSWGRDRGIGGRAEDAFAALLVIALLSVLWRVIDQGGIAFLGPMLRGGVILAVDFAAFTLARRLAGTGRLPALVLLLAAVLSSAYVADTGFTEYLTHKHAGQPDWRIFATSTPDFLAGFLVLLLPPTLALFVGLPWRRDKTIISAPLLLLLLIILGLQAIVLLRTQSRFALVSLAVGLLVYGLALWRAWRGGLIVSASTRGRLGAVALALLLFGVGFARPVLARLRQTSATDNSTAFRLYTWRGCVKMAAANPVLGTGVGSWVEIYPRYAVTGFTRLAHNGYLQMGDECGLPGLAALLATLGCVGVAGWRGLSIPRSDPASEPPGVRQLLAFVAPDDDRLLLAGLLGGLAASAVQNLIDSDWYVFFLGLTFWAVAGLVAPSRPPALDNGGAGGEPHLTSPQSRGGTGKEQAPLTPPPALRGRPGGGSPRLRMAAGLGTAVIALYMAAQAVSALDAQQANAALASNSPNATATAEQDYATASQWDPLNGHYPANLGLQVFFQREGRLPDALAALRTATRLEPSSLNYAYLGAVLNADHQFADALSALRQGLQADPNSVEIRLTLSQMLPPPQSVDFCRQITALEDGPVGRVRALGNVIEYRFPIADSCVADAAPDPATAARYYARAAADLEAYADEGGTTDPQRQALMGDHPAPQLDAQMRDLYAHVMPRLIALSPPAARPALAARQEGYRTKLADVFARASQPGTL